MGYRRIVVTSWLLILLLTACGRRSPAGAPPGSAGVSSPKPGPTVTTNSGSTSFLGRDLMAGSPRVVFVQWTESAGSLSGQLQTFSVDRFGMPSNQTAALTGSRTESSVNLSVPQVQQVMSGTLNGGGLALLMPGDRSAPSAEIQLRKATVQDYNIAISDLQNEVTKNEARLNSLLAGKWEASKENDYLTMADFQIRAARFELTGQFTFIGKSGSAVSGRYYLESNVLRLLGVSAGGRIDSLEFSLAANALSLKSGVSDESARSVEFRRT